MLAHLQPSRLFDQAKGIFNGVSQGLTLYTTKSASRSTSAHTGMRRRQPRTSFILVASMVRLLLKESTLYALRKRR